MSSLRRSFRTKLSLAETRALINTRQQLYHSRTREDRAWLTIPPRKRMVHRATHSSRASPFLVDPLLGIRKASVGVRTYREKPISFLRSLKEANRLKVELMAFRSL